MNYKKMLYRCKQLNFVLESSECLLYGAGIVAKAVIRYAKNRHSIIEQIFVSNMEGNPCELMGIPVRVINDCKARHKRQTLIVCLMENLHDEVGKIIETFEFEEVYYISNELFRKIEKKQEVYWHAVWERKVIQENWGIVIENQDFGDKFLNLVKNLDEKSIEIIIRILERQEQILKSDKEMLDLFTRKEKRSLRDLQENYWPFVLKIREGLYSYKQYLLPCNHFEPSVFYYKHGIENCRNLKSVKGKTIIDVGGFIGDSALILSELEPSGIISFEAVPEHVKLMEETIKLNHLEHVIPVNSALGEREGTININLAGASSTMIERGGVDFKGEIIVPVINLDKYVEKNNVKNIGLIKVDIEGAEPDFLLGAKATIAKYKPILLLSIYHNVHDFFELKPMIESWDLGYKFSVYKSVNGVVTNETLLIAEVY